ncbi:Tubulin polyglutamylase TTLL4 [Hondaea fermentalgiana]|uniref:Tubulin polyglutamylase TTLL4 n=1 Tax=Hondaea fermentalgiana TaxID=2315210 RepID=A0A2R5G2X6_9STRA|nr:Tubulin polyglutamylase TTLL4 [Hondaea fermentalgiana]|eukprot:GBG25386.1 Tubulin polyglutamylase TTLL4 [Hondaea fermentalgiana]
MIVLGLAGLAAWSAGLLLVHDALRARSAAEMQMQQPADVDSARESSSHALAGREMPAYGDDRVKDGEEEEKEDARQDAFLGDPGFHGAQLEGEQPSFERARNEKAGQVASNELSPSSRDAPASTMEQVRAIEPVVAEAKEWHLLDETVAMFIDAADAERITPVGAWQAGEVSLPSASESIPGGPVTQIVDAFAPRDVQQRAELLLFACKAVRDKVNWDPVEGKSRQRPKEAIIVGTSSIIQRDLKPVSQAYRLLGLKVEEVSKLSTAVAHGRASGSLRSVRHRDWGVILCLSLNTEKCLFDADFLRLEADQAAFSRVNRVIGLQEVLWSKDKYCTTVKRSGVWVPAYTFPCWVLPAEREPLKRHLRRGSSVGDSAWIIKPFKQGGGKGIFVLDSNAELQALVSQDSRKLIVQPYLLHPHLLEGRKWDLRTYVLVTSVSPFARGYLFRDGLVRLATDRYNPNARHGGNKTQYLTNTSVNKKKQQDMDLLTWSFGKLENALGFDRFQLLFARMRRAIGMLLVTAERPFAEYFESLSPGFRCANCYHLLGVDLIVDANLVPRVIEVNGEPSMKMSGAAQSHYDTTKNQMQQEVARIALKARRGLPTRTAARLLHRCGVSEAEVRALARDEDMLMYLMNLDRESASAENFHLVYPDPDACEGGARARLWDKFIDEVVANAPDAHQTRRKLLHALSRRYVCL